MISILVYILLHISLILTHIIYQIHNLGGSSWSQTFVTDASWTAVTSDSSGQYLAAVSSYNGIYTSSTGGSSWTKTTAPAAQWSAIASDSSGMHLVAVQGSRYGRWNSEGGIIYTSTSGKCFVVLFTILICIIPHSV